jgi:hypothetical protein
MKTYGNTDDKVNSNEQRTQSIHLYSSIPAFVLSNISYNLAWDYKVLAAKQNALFSVEYSRNVHILGPLNSERYLKILFLWL